MGGVFCIVGIPGVQARDFPFNEQFDCFVLTLSGCSVDKPLTLEGKHCFFNQSFAQSTHLKRTLGIVQKSPFLAKVQAL